MKLLHQQIYRALKARAKSHGRSLNKEIIATLEGTIGSSRINTGEIFGHTREVRDTMEVYLGQAELTSFKNKGRR